MIVAAQAPQFAADDVPLPVIAVVAAVIICCPHRALRAVMPSPLLPVLRVHCPVVQAAPLTVIAAALVRILIAASLAALSVPVEPELGEVLLPVALTTLSKAPAVMPAISQRKLTPKPEFAPV